MKFASGLIAYSQAERDADSEAMREAVKRTHARRKVMVSGQDYESPANAATEARDRRILGETTE